MGGPLRRSPGWDVRLLGVGPRMFPRTRLQYFGRSLFRPWRDYAAPPSLVPAMNRWAIINRPWQDAEGPILLGLAQAQLWGLISIPSFLSNPFTAPPQNSGRESPSNEIGDTSS